ncbi:hypothetical protein R1sor_020784 [Riccia sorocarpa]|uniref:PGG domain-containing protein n=1 Tax=Riccia sorocarpa TaxID=122646 RepID=A0ABD3GFX4_9MARC
MDDSRDPLNEKYKARVKGEKKTQITLTRMHKDFIASINSYAVVLVLLASVTYVGFLQPPGGTENEGSAPAPAASQLPHLSRKPAMTVFIVFNFLSFILAVSDLLLCVLSSLSPLRSIATSSGIEDWMATSDDGQLTLQAEQATTKLLARYVSSTLVKLIFVNAIFAISLTCCVVAYGAAGIVVVKKDRQNANFLAVIVTLAVGSCFFAFFFIWLLNYTFRFIQRVLTDESLSTSLQHRASNAVRDTEVNAGNPGIRQLTEGKLDVHSTAYDRAFVSPITPKHDFHVHIGVL